MLKVLDSVGRTRRVRLWSIHPSYLDSKGLVALWREAVLAQAVLRGETKGYLNHPQLDRFRAHPRPLEAIADYLDGVATEADRRGYKFNHDKIGPRRGTTRIAVTTGQLDFECTHLEGKLRKRDRSALTRLREAGLPEPHPIFVTESGEIADFERGTV